MNSKASDSLPAAEQDLRLESKTRMYEAIRRQIEHEDGLVNQRFTWALNSSGFLFAGYFLLLTNMDKFIDHKQIGLFIVVILIICVFGCISCRLYNNSIKHANVALDSLRKTWHDSFPEESTMPAKYPRNTYPHIHHWNEKNSKDFFQSGARGVIKMLFYGWMLIGVVSACFLFASLYSIYIQRKPQSHPITMATRRVVRE